MAQEPSEILDEIAETRAELAETVHALAEKANVKSRLRATLAENTAQLHARASQLGGRVRQVTPEKAKAGLRIARSKPWLLPAVIAVLTGLLLGRRMVRSR